MSKQSIRVEEICQLSHGARKCRQNNETKDI